MQKAASDEANNSTTHNNASSFSSFYSASELIEEDFKINDYNAYKLLQPISHLYTEECTTMFQGLLRFCEEFEGSTMVEMSTEFYRTKEMCVNLRVSGSTRGYFVSSIYHIVCSAITTLRPSTRRAN